MNSNLKKLKMFEQVKISGGFKKLKKSETSVEGVQQKNVK